MLTYAAVCGRRMKREVPRLRQCNAMYTRSFCVIYTQALLFSLYLMGSAGHSHALDGLSGSALLLNEAFWKALYSWLILRI